MLTTPHLSCVRKSSGKYDLYLNQLMKIWRKKIGMDWTACNLCFICFRTLVTTTVLCYFLGVHDFMLVITGSLADIAGSATEVNDTFISIQTLHLFIKCRF